LIEFENNNRIGGDHLREFLEIMQRLPYVCVITALLIILPGLVTKHQILISPSIAAVVIIAGSLFTRLWFQIHPESLKAIFLMNYGASVFLIVGLFCALYETRRYSRLEWLFTEYLTVYVLIFFIVWVAGSFFLKQRSQIKTKYTELQTYLSDGVITLSQLWHWMFNNGGSIKGLKWWIGGVASFAVVGTLLAAGFGGRDIVGYFYFLIFLALTPSVLAVVTVRVWAHWKYLDCRDLKII
jgi:hypothetical protein